MSSSRADAIAVHVEAAKRLLAELEQHAETAMLALEQEGGGSEFFEAVDAREPILAQLNTVVEALAHERVALDGSATAEDDRTGVLLAEMAKAAAAALESHGQLVARTKMERDRLAGALGRTSRPDAIAGLYAAASNALPQRTLSVTG